MTKRMLIDASHPDETRVVVLDGNTVEEFDYERADRKPLKGNIYLAKVTRVEPSLQAAFVEYGGNRHGFLPFSEIHPDYYRIPVADREALLAEEEAISQKLLSDADEAADEDEPAEDQRAEAEESDDEDEADEDADREDANREDDDHDEDDNGDEADGESEHKSSSRGKSDAAVEELETEGSVDTLGGDEVEEQLRRRAQLLRKYKIQEVIRRRQVMLVQVTKEERGTKGAALTTYLSLAGRYCVLMPNSGKGGGISRKISNVSDRRRLKKVLGELKIPQGMAVIVRTAGGQRSKAEIRRDYDYLIRLWDQIRNETLESSAPSLIHEEGNLLNRAIRDQYTREMDEVLVEGDEGYKAAKNFMKMLMPSHAKKVKPYKDERMPLFQRFQVESNLDSMYSPQVHLKSGGSIVLNPTEALVAIDVNSGKATRERHIEETALKTNLEAAEEIGRQLRLRDLAGLIVIDFIDMEESRHNRDVERRLKDALKSDRARIQLGRISPFGLLELSRQRLRPSLVEMSSVPCPHCGGAGVVRSKDSACMQILRSLTDIGINHTNSTCQVKLNNELALYLLSEKRKQISEIEDRYGVTVQIEVDDSLNIGEFSVDRVSDSDGPIKERGEAQQQDEEESDDDDAGRGKRGRRGGRKRRKGPQKSEAREESKSSTPQDADEESDEDEDQEDDDNQRQSAGGDDDDDGKSRKRRRRGRRGGRRRSRKKDTGQGGEESSGDEKKADQTNADQDNGHQGKAGDEDGSEADAADGDDASDEGDTPKKRGGRRSNRGGGKSSRGKPKADNDDAGTEETPEQETDQTAAKADAQTDESQQSDKAESGASEDKPKQSEDKPSQTQEREAEPVGAGAPAEEEEAPRRKKRGWWNIGG